MDQRRAMLGVERLQAADFTTVAEEARRLGVSRRTVYRAVARGEIVAVRVGRVIRIRKPVVQGQFDA